ncbi:MAG: winged helix-turn-helix transcriptional regulator [Kineosporiaceae bacterium]
MARTSYDMHCAVAKALEVLGERWTLLVVRELLTGPKRYADLRAGLPGIATNMLTDRLRSLQAADVVTRRELPAPAASVVYELTERGRELKPVLLAMAAWGQPLLGRLQPGAQFRLAWLMVALDGAYDPAAVPDPLTLTVTVDGEQLTITAHGARHEVRDGPPADGGPADGGPGTLISVRADGSTFLDWATGLVSDAAAARAGLHVDPGDGLAVLRRMYRIGQDTPGVAAVVPPPSGH